MPTAKTNTFNEETQLIFSYEGSWVLKLDVQIALKISAKYFLK
jgi:hypothetical protein